MNTASDPSRLTPEEYLASEDAAEFRSEFYEGEIFAMSGGSYEHTVISSNLSRFLGNRLSGSGCRALNPELRVHVPDSTAYYYPDASVVCGSPVFATKDRTTVTNPVLVVEILSPSSERYDRTSKFWNYQKLPSLQDYVLITQEAPQVEVFSRHEASDQWLYKACKGLDALLHFPSLQLELPLREIYDGVEFQNPAQASES